MKNLQAFIKYLGNTRAKQRRNIMLTATLSVLVLFVVSIILTKPADSMSGKLICEKQVHVHNDLCRQLVCTMEEHICDESCTPQECTEVHICDENCVTAECEFTHLCDENCPPTDCPLVHECDENCVIPEFTEVHECDESCTPVVECTPHQHSDECYEIVCELEEHEHSQECYEVATQSIMGTLYGNRIQILAEDPATQWFDEVPTVLPTPNQNVNSSLIKEGTDFTTNYTGIISQNNSIIDKNPVQFQIAFRFDETKIDALRSNGTQYLYYPLPEGIEFQQPVSGENCTVKDQNSEITAYYTLANNIGGKNYIIFRITDNYFQNKLNNTSDYTCKILFDTYVYRDTSNDNGDRKVVFGTDAGSNEISETVNFVTLAPSMSKDGKIIEAEGKKPVIEWSVTIKNPAKYASLEGYKFSDTMLNTAIQDTVKVTPSDIFDSSWVLKRDLNDDETVTITYQTAISDEKLHAETAESIKNTATLTKEGKDDITVSKDVYVDTYRTLSKVVNPDYRVAGAGLNYNLFWTITAENKLYTPLGGYSLTDDAFTSAKDLVVKDSKDNVIASDKYTITGNTLTFNSDFATHKVTVTYKSPYTPGVDNTNTVKLNAPNKTELKTATATFYTYSTYDPYNLNKTGTYNYDTGKVDWTINVTPNDSSLLNVDKLILIDSAFANASNLTIVGKDAKWQEKSGISFKYLKSLPVVSVSDTLDETETPSEDPTEASSDTPSEDPTEASSDTPSEDPTEASSDTPSEDPSEDASEPSSEESTEPTEAPTEDNSPTDIIQINLTDESIVILEIKYSTEPTELEKEQIKNATPSEPFKFENTVQLNLNSYTESVTGIAEYRPITEITKTLKHEDTADAEFFLSNIDSVPKKVLHWTVEITHDTNFADGTKAFVDVIQALDKTVDPPVPSTQADHYISPAQKVYKSSTDTDNVIVLYGKSTKNEIWDNAEKIDSSCYEVTFYTDDSQTQIADSAENARSFRIEFNSGIDSLGYKYLKIEYQTTADVSKVTSETKVSFNNTASFNEKDATPHDSFEVKVIDNSVVPYSKHAVDKKSNELENGTLVNLANVQKHTVHDYYYNTDTEYYVFGWKVNIDPTYKSSKITFTDTFNDGFTLCTDSPYSPARYYYSNDQYNRTDMGRGDEWYTPDNGYKYNANEQTVKFVNLVNNDYFIYYTMIPATELEQRIKDAGALGYKISNTLAHADNEFKSVSADIRVTDQAEILKKKYVPHIENLAEGAIDKGDNKLSYSIEINPEARDLSNGDQLILKDDFLTTKFNDNSFVGPDIADVLLSKLLIYEIHPDKTESLLPASEYSYQYFEEGQGQIEVTPTKTEKNPNYSWSFSNLAPGDEVTITLKSDTPNYLFDKNGGWNNGENYLCYSFTEYSNDYKLNMDAPLQFDSNGEYTFTVTVPKDKNVVWINCWQTKLVDANATVKRRTSSSELHLVIPDATHLRIEYVYTLLKDGKEIRNKTIGFTNTVTLTGNDSYTSTVDENFLEFSYDTAQATITYYPTIKKLDIADRTIDNLEAQFKIAMYDSEASKWKWYNQALTNRMAINSINWVDSPDSIQITTVPGSLEILGLEAGNIYALIEVQEPTNVPDYTYEDADILEPFYFSYGSTPASYPPGIDNEKLSSSNVKTIIENGEIPVTNNRIIDVNAVKYWDEPQNYATVDVELYWSYTRSFNGFPSDMTLATAEDLGLDEGTLTNPATFIDTYVWKNLPNGKDGKPIYYYAKEKSYTIQGNKYQVGSSNAEFVPLYKGNALNSSSSVIEITNASSLQIKKLWYDYKNNPLPENYTQEIEFRIWGRVDKDDDETLIKNGDEETFKINSESGWKYKFDTSLIEKYNYFRVEEVNVPEGFTPSYNENYEKQSGSITIINKNPDIKNPVTSITVEKTWNDGTYANRPTSLDLKLMSSTDMSDWQDTNISAPAPEINGNVWTYTYDNLPYRDDNSNILYYKVSEPSVSGYNLATTINNGGISSGTIKLVNEKKLNLTLQKEWSDLYRNQHTDDKVTVNIYRTTNQDDINNASDSELADTVEIKHSDNWSVNVNNLPACNPDGTLYYYWIEEVTVSGYTPTYRYDGSDQSKSITYDNGTVAINNEYIYEPAELPSTGGTGEIIYYIMGMIAIIIGCSLYIAHYIKYEKRR